MTTLFLIRHATTASTGKKLGGRTDAALDEPGRAQAAAAAARLADVPFAAVYTSPLPRTTETAEIVAAPHGLAVRPAEGLLEVEYGRWTDRSLAQVSKQKLWPVIQSRPSLVSFPDGETIRAAQLRAVDAVEEIVAASKGKVVAAVSHADVIKAVVSFYLGQPLDLFQRLVINPASVTVLQLEPGGRPALLRLNDDGPVDGEQLRTRAGRGKAAKAASPKAAAARKTLRSGGRG
jgi:probable phosphomutase (TIGR03848 family)